MGIEEEIFDEFLEKLREDKTIPNQVIEGLRELLESGNVLRSEIFEIIKKVNIDDNKD